MFDPQTGSPNQAYFQQQAAYNPFLRQQMPAPFGPLAPQMTGAMAFGQQPFGLTPEMTGFAAFGQGGMNAFGQPQMMQPQPTGFLQPQATGFNPFRQSVMMPQMTGMNPFGQQQPQPFSPFGQPGGQQQQQPQQAQAPTPQKQSSVPQLQPQWTGIQAFQRPASTPASPAKPVGMPQAGGLNAPQQQQSSPHPLAPQPTGSKNPFAPPPGSQPAEPPKPPAPPMNQIAFQAFQNMQIQNQQGQQQPQQQPAQGQQNAGQARAFSAPSQQQNGSSFGDLFGSSELPKPQMPQQTGLMSSLASDFAFGRAVSPSSSTPAQTNGAQPNGLPSSTAGSLPSFGASAAPSAVSSSNTGASAPSFSFSSSSGPSSAFGSNSQNTGSSAFSSSTFAGSNGQQPSALQPQPTGFGGSSVKPFQPSSSFGTSLFAEQANKPTSPSPLSQQQQTSSQPQQGQQQQQMGNLLSSFGGSSFGQGSISNQQQQSSLQPQPTGGPNPFRMSMMPGNNSQTSTNAFTPSFFGNAGQQQPAQQSTAGSSNTQWGSLI